MGFNDLRSFMASLEAAGELHHIKARVEKDWEVGTICRENFDRWGPALVFHQVEGFRTPLVVGMLGTRQRYAAALETAPTVTALGEKWHLAYAEPQPPKVVPRPPCKEVILDQVDLYKDPFPVPKWHLLDAGPELGTFHAIITRDPDTGWINLGDYRNQILNHNTLGCLVIPYRHIGLHWAKWKKRGKPMPVAIAIGLDPYLNLVSTTAVPANMDEYDVAGGLKKGPIEVVQAETCDLLVPAQAEIILEGEMPIDDFWPQEGPFGEFTGYMGEPRTNSHYIRIHKITHRHDPFFQATLEGRPPNESTTCRALGRSFAMYEHLKRAGIPGILDVCATEDSCAGFHVVVSIEKSYPGHVRDVMGHVWGHPNLYAKHCIVVDEDVDPWDPFRVQWAIATRVQAGRDVEIIRNGKSVVLDPSQVPSRRGWSDLMGIDATKPTDEYRFDGEESFPASTDPPREWLERVREQWALYGFKP